VRFEVLTLVEMSMFLFWVVTPCGDGDSMFLQNIGISL
jgi:hypothetical protein